MFRYLLYRYVGVDMMHDCDRIFSLAQYDAFLHLVLQGSDHGYTVGGKHERFTDLLQ